MTNGMSTKQRTRSKEAGGGAAGGLAANLSNALEKNGRGKRGLGEERV